MFSLGEIFKFLSQSVAVSIMTCVCRLVANMLIIVNEHLTLNFVKNNSYQVTD